ncbi:MAG: hypothetical protein R2852_10070 [Bacteroidia bacterium]
MNLLNLPLNFDEIIEASYWIVGFPSIQLFIDDRLIHQQFENYSTVGRFQNNLSAFNIVAPRGDTIPVSIVKYNLLKGEHNFKIYETVYTGTDKTHKEGYINLSKFKNIETGNLIDDYSIEINRNTDIFYRRVIPTGLKYSISAINEKVENLKLLTNIKLDVFGFKNQEVFISIKLEDALGTVLVTVPPKVLKLDDNIETDIRIPLLSPSNSLNLNQFYYPKVSILDENDFVLSVLPESMIYFIKNSSDSLEIHSMQNNYLKLYGFADNSINTSKT